MFHFVRLTFSFFRFSPPLYFYSEDGDAVLPRDLKSELYSDPYPPLGVEYSERAVRRSIQSLLSYPFDGSSKIFKGLFSVS